MRRVLAYAAILIVAGACAMGEILTDYGDPVDMRPADLVGTWVSGKDRSIVFDEDGTFAASNLPYELFDEFVPEGFNPADQLDGCGTWSLEVPISASHDRKSKVALSFDRLAGTEVASAGPSPSALRQDGVVYLIFFYVGSGGNSWTAYHK